MDQCTQSNYFLNFNRSDSAQIYHRIMKTRSYLHSKRKWTFRIRNTSSVSTKYLAARGNGDSDLESILQILSSTKQNNLVLTSTSSTAKATIDAQPWQERQWCTGPYQEHPKLFSCTALHDVGGPWSELCRRSEEYDWNCEICHYIILWQSQAQETGSKYTFIVWNQMERKVQKHPHLFKELL